MKEENIMKGAMFCTVMGIIGIILIQNFIDVPLVSISSLSKSDIDKYVRLNGNPTNVFSSDSISGFVLDDGTGSLPIVIFSETINIQKLSKNIQVLGKVSFYDGKLQVIADSINDIE